MIIKIRKDENQWVYFDNIDKFVNMGQQDDSSLNSIDAEYTIDENIAYFVIELTKYRSDDKSHFSRIVAIQEAYLLNDEGKTIDKIIA